MYRKKFFLVTTVARTLYFFSGQPRIWSNTFDVCAISSEKDGLQGFAETEGIRYKYIPMHREISIFSDIYCLIRLIWLFIIERPDVVHGNTPKASMLSMVAAWLTRRPVRIYMCHGLRYQTAHGFLRFILKSMERLSCSCATTVIGVSNGVIEQLVSDGLCRKGKAIIVGYGTAGGVDTNYFCQEVLKNHPSIREELGIPENAFIFCFTGRIVKDKGINELVKAFDSLSKNNKSVYLLLIGPREDNINPISKDARFVIETNSRIKSLGWKKDIRPYLAISNAFILPSHREGLGQVLLEANSMSIPCIASDIIGPRDVICPNINGELFEAGNVIALYNLMKEWVDNPDHVAAMSNKCRNFILERYDSIHVIDNYCNVYLSLAGVANLNTL